MSAAVAAAVAFSLGMVSWLLGQPATNGVIRPEGARGSAGGGAPPAGSASSLLAERSPTGSSGARLEWASATGEGVEDGLDWLDAAPKDAGSERELYFFDAVRRGGARIDWSTISIGPATIPVFARTLRIGRKRPVRIMSDFMTTQALADLLGCAMMTPAIAAEAFKQAQVKLSPQLRKWSEDGTMTKTYRLREYTLAEDALVSPEETRLVANEGKQWVVSIRFWRDTDPKKRFPTGERSANYGWFSKSAPNGATFQPVGLMHNFFHSDYSQQVQLVSQWWKVGGAPMHISDAFKDPVLGPLVSAGEACGSLVYCPKGPQDLILPFYKHPFFQAHEPHLKDGRSYPLPAGGGVRA